MIKPDHSHLHKSPNKKNPDTAEFNKSFKKGCITRIGDSNTIGLKVYNSKSIHSFTFSTIKRMDETLDIFGIGYIGENGSTVHNLPMMSMSSIRKGTITFNSPQHDINMDFNGLFFDEN